MGFVEKLGTIDRRVIFLLIAIAVIIPLILPIGLPSKVTVPVKNCYDYIEELPKGSTVLISADYDPSTLPEIQPMCVAILYHCFLKEHKVILMALWPQGAALSEQAVQEIRDNFDIEYGRDYINLGYKINANATLLAMGTSIRETFPLDVNGDPIDSFPIMNGIKNYNDIDLVVALSAGDPGIPIWVQVANSRFGVQIIGGCTAVSAPQFYPYLQTGQMIGLLGGMKGAAEYEALINRKGTATAGMDAQSIAHLVIILFIIIANVTYFMMRKKEKLSE